MTNLVTFPALGEEFQIGLLSFGREAGLKASDLSLPHPDNFIGWNIVASEVLLTVANLAGTKLPARTLAKAIPAFRTNHVPDEVVKDWFNEVSETLINHLLAIAPEDYFSEYKASQVKRSITSAANNLRKVLEENGHLVFFQLVYLSAIGASEEGEEMLDFVSALLDPEMPQMYNPAEILKTVRAVRKQYKAWDKSNVKIASKMEFTELDIEESLA